MEAKVSSIYMPSIFIRVKSTIGHAVSICLDRKLCLPNNFLFMNKLNRQYLHALQSKMNLLLAPKNRC